MGAFLPETSMSLPVSLPAALYVTGTDTGIGKTFSSCVLLHALRQSDFNISACARTMQVSRVTIYRLCRKHQLALPELR